MWRVWKSNPPIMIANHDRQPWNMTPQFTLSIIKIGQQHFRREKTILLGKCELPIVTLFGFEPKSMPSEGSVVAVTLQGNIKFKLYPYTIH